MSEYPDLPDNIKRAIEDLLQTLSGMTAEEIFHLLGEMLGDDEMVDFVSMMEENEDHFLDLDDWGLNIDQLLEEFAPINPYDLHDVVKEPYYEISHRDNEIGEIIVEMPGLASNSLIDYYFFDNELFICSADTVENYKIIIPIPEYYHILEDEMVYRNGLLIIPFQIY